MAFLITMTYGLIIGFVYDFFRVILNNGKKSKLKLVLIDTTFWIISGIALSASFYYSDNMNLRLYQFLGTISGLLLYFLFFSFLISGLHTGIYKIFEFFFKILFTIAKFFAIIMVRILNLIIFPFKRIYKFLKKLVNLTKNKIKINLKLMRKV